MTAAIEKGTASGYVLADLNSDGTIDEADLSLLERFISGEISYFPVGATYTADAGFVTRGEWIHSLVMTFEISVTSQALQAAKSGFTDLTGSEYEDDIRTAAYFGMFTYKTGYLFRPDAFVTREFAAHALNFCLAYETSGFTLETDDLNDVSVAYQRDAAVVAAKGWLTLAGNEFRPALYITGAECSGMLTDAQETLDSAVIDKNRDPSENKAIVKDSVVQFDEKHSRSLFRKRQYGYH